MPLGTVGTMTLSIGLAYIYYLSLHAQNTEHENASQAFVVQCCWCDVRSEVVSINLHNLNGV